MSWTDERVAVLKKLWGDGKTAAEIAKELGGVTRNAVIGKAHRLKLSNRVSPIQQNKKPKVQAQNQNPAPEKRPPRNVAPKKDEIKGGVPLVDLKANECRWPQGDPQEEEFGFCGKRALSGLPYCEHHVAAAYQPATRNRILKSEAAQNASKAAAAAVQTAKVKKAASA